MNAVTGEATLDRTPNHILDLGTAGMRMPDWREEMHTHLNPALRSGRTWPGQSLTDDAALARSRCRSGSSGARTTCTAVPRSASGRSNCHREDI